MSEGPTATMSRKDKTIEERYRKMGHEEHVLERPDSYVGSCQRQDVELWIHDGEKIVLKTLSIVPALYKIFDEILVNAADNKVNDPSMDELRVEVDQEAGEISVWNNGAGIPVQVHSLHNIYVPQLIFSELLTSDNYDDTENKVTGGRNGYGAKLTNIYSNKFTIETCDAERMLKYKQSFQKNMTIKSEPKITPMKKKESWTKVTFQPDLSRFENMTSLEDDMVGLMRKRTYDMAGVLGGKKTKVSFNGTRIKVKNFQDYIDLYLGPKGPEKPRVYEQVNDRWEVCVAPTDGDKMQQVAFVNSICTSRGGKHVDYVLKQITDKLVEEVAKKTKTKGLIKASHVRNHLWVFLNCQINNPSFDSQTKDCLTSNISTFGSKCQITDEFLKKVKKSGILERLEELVKFRGEQALKKTDGAKRTRLHIPKLEDAHEAGSRTSHHCTLILTEGDSAKTFAMAGLEVVGRHRYGVFPLRGKLLNVRDASNSVVSKNEEIQNLKKIIGLQHGKNYEDTKSLRYGHVMIMADQDHDGSHIKGLIINFIHKFYPSLLKLPGFMQSFVTPVVKATKKTGNKETIAFYTMPEYKAWRQTVDASKYMIKYYKGLGSSTGKEAKASFTALDTNQKLFIHDGMPDDDAIDKAFSRLRTEDRKEWLNSFEQGTFLDHHQPQFTYSEFVDKELILFSVADVGRSIPSLMDGFKPAQRKIMYCCFKRNLKYENAAIKVSELAGYVSEHSMYHHGEMSLHQAIVALAQNFCGSNNINLLEPEGQFGSRLQGGKDHASARYIKTKMTKLTRCIFHPDDDAILKYLEEDGQTIEPEWYPPIVPMVLVNGAEGIGTGWSTSIPNYNPRDLVANLKRMLDGSEPVKMTPWYKHFKGTIQFVQGTEEEVTVAGMVTVDENEGNSVEITELPVKKWTTPYSEFLVNLINPPKEKDEPILEDCMNDSTPGSPHFHLQVIPAKMNKIRAEGSFYKTFNLKTRWKLSNFVLIDRDQKVVRYRTAEDILKAFFDVRQEFYAKRIDAKRKEAERMLCKLKNMIRFVLAVANGEFIVNKRKKTDIEADLESHGYDKFASGGEEDDKASFNYLLNMPIFSVTYEKVESLQKQVAEQEEKARWWAEITVKELWTIDLDNFLKVLEEVEEDERMEEEADNEVNRMRRAQAAKRTAKKPRRKAVRATSEVTEATMPPPASRGGGRGGRGGKRGRGGRGGATPTASAEASQPSKMESLREKLAKKKAGSALADADDGDDLDEVTSPLPASMEHIATGKTEKKEKQPKRAPKRKANVLPSSSEEDSDDEDRQEEKVPRLDLTAEGLSPIPEDAGPSRQGRARRAHTQQKIEATSLLSSDDENSTEVDSDDKNDSDFALSE